MIAGALGDHGIQERWFGFSIVSYMGDLHLWECAADNVRLMSGIQLKPRTNFLLKMGKCSTARDAPTAPVGLVTRYDCFKISCT